MDAAQPSLAIETHGLTKSFGKFRAVDAVDLSVPAGSVYAMLGPNGAGKTTTVQMLATLLRPDAGDARIFGRDVVRDATAVRSLIGVTGQYASVDEDLTALENLMIFARLHGLSRSRAKTKSAELLEEFGLAEVSGRLVKRFSGGMRRRVDLAASLLAAPPLLFLDEPTTGLDPRTRAQMWTTVRELVAGGCTVLLTTQYLEEADQLADRIAVIEKGRLVADGTADDLKSAVGLSTLTLAIADADRIAEAAQIASVLLDVEPTTIRRDGRLMMPVPDTVRVPELLIALRDKGIDVTEINVAKPTLDEVFFALTGTPDAVTRS